MRNKLLTAACLFFGAIGSTHAQAGGVKVRVPFDFEFANKTLPAAEYVVSSERGQVLLRGADGKIVAMVQANHADFDGRESAKVVFHCYERRCYFSQFWNPETQIGREVARSKAETELAKRQEMKVFALLGEPSPR